LIQVRRPASYPCPKKQITLYRWRTLWQGKWVTTRYLANEEQIRIAYPGAQRIEGTVEVRTVVETDNGVRAASTSVFMVDDHRAETPKAALVNWT
jgi:hypothetical protein